MSRLAENGLWARETALGRAASATGSPGNATDLATPPLWETCASAGSAAPPERGSASNTATAYSSIPVSPSDFAMIAAPQESLKMLTTVRYMSSGRSTASIAPTMSST